MSPLLVATILLPAFAILAFLFGRNAVKGLQTGTIYAQGACYDRIASPILFWISFSFSTAFVAFSVAAMGVLGWVVVSLY